MFVDNLLLETIDICDLSNTRADNCPCSMLKMRIKIAILVGPHYNTSCWRRLEPGIHFFHTQDAGPERETETERTHAKIAR